MLAGNTLTINEEARFISPFLARSFKAHVGCVDKLLLCPVGSCIKLDFGERFQLTSIDIVSTIDVHYCRQACEDTKLSNTIGQRELQVPEYAKVSYGLISRELSSK